MQAWDREAKSTESGEGAREGVTTGSTSAPAATGGYTETIPGAAERLDMS